MPSLRGLRHSVSTVVVFRQYAVHEYRGGIHRSYQYHLIPRAPLQSGILGVEKQLHLLQLSHSSLMTIPDGNHGEDVLGGLDIRDWGGSGQ